MADQRPHFGFRQRRIAHLQLPWPARPVARPAAGRSADRQRPAAPKRRPARHDRSRPWPTAAGRASRSASAATITGATPPCSSEQRVPGASRERKHPAHLAAADEAEEAHPPVGDHLLAQVAGRSTSSGWHHSSGRPASRRIRTKRKQESGVASAGLTITGQPAATAGPT